MKRDRTYRWTHTAVDCYRNKMRCKNCINEHFCKVQPRNNDYGIIPMKYSLLKTFSIYGKEGLNEFLLRNKVEGEANWLNM